MRLAGTDRGQKTDTPVVASHSVMGDYDRPAAAEDRTIAVRAGRSPLGMGGVSTWHLGRRGHLQHKLVRGAGARDRWEGAVRTVAEAEAG